MPAISKIRIVNFTYNDGKRIIPDELFVFEDSNRHCVDTLINLHNGGGKSVIIQLIMQNILPKAALQGRKIESYFNKSTDHSFVLIEWHLDNSEYRLMTGVAITAGTNAESGSNASVRFFTFMNHYTIKGDKNDILSIPLSVRENGRFKAISFEEARSYIKGRMDYFSADDLRGYYDRLNEYGIMRSEWEKILRPINNREGGVEDFFKYCKTADDLLDSFIIPGVSSNNDTKRSDDDSSMQSMFRNYAGSYASKKDTIALRDDTEAFVKRLEELVPDVEQLWNIWSEYNSSLERLYDYAYSLQIVLKEAQNRADRVKEQTEEQKARLEHIRLEELSGKYYLYRDEYDALNKQYGEQNEILYDLKKKRTEAAHYFDVLNAARSYKRLCEYESKRDAVIRQIEEKSNQGENEYKHSLEYSLKAADEQCSAENDERLNRLKNEIEANTSLIEENTKKYNTLHTQVKELERKANQLIGVKNERENSIDRRMNCLGVHITKMLDGFYSSDDIERVSKELDGIYNELCKTGEQLAVSLKAVEIETDSLRDEKGGYVIRMAELERELADKAAMLEKYIAQRERVLDIYREWNVSEDKLFGDELFTLLTDKAAEIASECRLNEKRLDSLEEQLEYAKGGKLHIPKETQRFLEDLNIKYQTGEEYLLAQEETVRAEILKCNPSAPYSVIVPADRDRAEILKASGEELWLPGLLPIYTYSDFAAMTEGGFCSDNKTLSAYCREYFADSANYIDKLADSAEQLKREYELNKSRLSTVSSQIETVKSFDYMPEYYDSLIAEQNSLNDEKSALNNKIKAIEERLDNITAEKQNINNLISTNNEDRIKAERNINDFKELKDSIGEYVKICEQYAAVKGELSQKENMSAKTQKQLDELRHKADELGNSFNDAKRLADDYAKTLARLKGCKEGGLIDGDYDSLKAKYDEYLQSCSKEINELKSTLESYEDSINNERLALESLHVESDEYKDTDFSEKELANVRDKMSALDKSITDTQGRVNTLYNKLSKAEANAESYVMQLNELGSQPLPKSEIGDRLDERRRECKELLKELNKQSISLNDEISNVSSNIKSVNKTLNKHKLDYVPKQLNIDGLDGDELEDRIETAMSRLKTEERQFADNVKVSLTVYANKNNIFRATVEGICTYAGSDGENREKYYTLYERIPKDIERYRQNIARLEIDLADIDSSKTQLISACANQAESLYQSLKTLTSKSRVNIYGSLKNMLKINLPEVEDKSLAWHNIEKHIDGYVKQYVDTCLDSSASQNAKESLIDKSVDLRKLLNCYIGTEDIPVSVYKVDSNPQRCEYRLWEKALTANSGGEKFVVFFALVLSMMNYSRGVMESLDKSKASGVLIMDNPFGPISSGHLLEPMFEIARHFNIQLICFSHLDTAEITACFTNVCRLKTKQLPFSGMEILETQMEQKQEMEHAFFRSEQMSLF